MSDRLEKTLQYSLLLFLIVILGFSVYTYYTDLSQYATTDQMEATYPRIQKFLANSDSIEFGRGGYNFSFITTGKIGKIIDDKLKLKYQLQDNITGNIYYTLPFPFTVIQVSITLVLLLLAVFLLCILLELNLKSEIGYIYYLFIAVVLLNLPMLKGEAKLLKYDSISFSFSLLALLMYLIYKKTEKKLHLIILGSFSAFMYMEKDTTFSVLGLIIVVELIRLQFMPGKNRDIIKSMLCFLGLFWSIFFLTLFIFVPRFWTHASELFSVFSTVKEYLQGMSSGMIFFLLVLAIAVYFLTRSWVNKSQPVVLTKIKNAKTSSPTLLNNFLIFIEKPRFYYGLFGIGVFIFIVALIYQENNIISIANADEQTLQEIKKNNLFVSPEMAGGVSYTTMDKNRLITSFKILFNNFRIFIYTKPEIAVLLFFLSFYLLSEGIKKNNSEFHKRYKPFMPILVFALLMILSFSFLLVLPEAKYNLLPNTLLVLFGMGILVLFLEYTLKGKWKYLIIIITVLCMLRPIAIGNPTYLGYINIFRDSEKENTDFLNKNKYSEWTWIGWGEASYGCLNFIEKNYPGKVNVLHDYLLPFHYSADITAQRGPDFRGVRKFSKENLRYYLNDLLENNFRFLLINKNWANRDFVSNYLIKNYRSKAIHREKIGKIEYAWLFEISQLLNELGGSFADYYINKGAELFKQNKHTEAIEKYNKALSIDSANIHAYTNLSLCYINLGDWNNALSTTEKALMLSPGSDELKQNLNFIKSKIK